MDLIGRLGTPFPVFYINPFSFCRRAHRQQQTKVLPNERTHSSLITNELYKARRTQSMILPIRHQELDTAPIVDSSLQYLSTSLPTINSNSGSTFAFGDQETSTSSFSLLFDEEDFFGQIEGLFQRPSSLRTQTDSFLSPIHEEKPFDEEKEEQEEEEEEEEKEFKLKENIVILNTIEPLPEHADDTILEKKRNCKEHTLVNEKQDNKFGEKSKFANIPSIVIEDQQMYFQLTTNNTPVAGGANRPQSLDIPSQTVCDAITDSPKKSPLKTFAIFSDSVGSESCDADDEASCYSSPANLRHARCSKQSLDLKQIRQRKISKLPSLDCPILLEDEILPVSATSCKSSKQVFEFDKEALSRTCSCPQDVNTIFKRLSDVSLHDIPHIKLASSPSSPTFAFKRQSSDRRSRRRDRQRKKGIHTMELSTLDLLTIFDTASRNTPSRLSLKMKKESEVYSLIN